MPSARPRLNRRPVGAKSGERGGRLDERHSPDLDNWFGVRKHGAGTAVEIARVAGALCADLTTVDVLFPALRKPVDDEIRSVIVVPNAIVGAKHEHRGASGARRRGAAGPRRRAEYD
jgi:hypothetical protein